MEVLTPVVRATSGEQVVVRFMNVSRDAYRGTLQLIDSVAAPVSHEVWLPGRGAVVLDTVRLMLRTQPPPGDRQMKLTLSGGGDLPFIVRSFAVRTDTGSPVGLVSNLDDSPVQRALARLQITWEKLGPVNAANLARHKVLLLDRDALEGSGPGGNGNILEWVRGGGLLVVMPPATAGTGSRPIPGAAYRDSPLLPPGTAVRVDSTARFAGSPNVLTSADWEGWVVARAFGSLEVDRGSRIIVASGNTPLVVSIPEGSGSVTLVALDLYSQLMNVHPGAHRILANLLQP